jgi:fatty-acid desaturase
MCMQTKNLTTRLATPFNIKEARQEIGYVPSRPTILVVAAIHMGAVASFWYFSWVNLVGFFVFYALGVWGITAGFHRLVTHKSFQTPKWLERVFVVLGLTAIQNGPIDWVAEHRLHHQESDTELDPHNIHKGFLWAHMGWMFQSRPEWFRQGMYATYAPDLMKDRFMVFADKMAIPFAVLMGVLMTFIGGFGFFLWAFCLKQAVLWHVTWFVNSASHLWGYRLFKHEQATNCWWVGLLAFGEGWHNTHHAFPTSARHGLRWWELDLTWLLIKSLSLMGLAKKVKLPAEENLPWKKAYKLKIANLQKKEVGDSGELSLLESIPVVTPAVTSVLGSRAS